MWDLLGEVKAGATCHGVPQGDCLFIFPLQKSAFAGQELSLKSLLDGANGLSV